MSGLLAQATWPTRPDFFLLVLKIRTKSKAHSRPSRKDVRGRTCQDFRQDLAPGVAIQGSQQPNLILGHAPPPNL